MLKIIKRLFGFSDKNDISGLGLEIRELIKGKEIDPQKLIELQAEINKMEAQHRTVFVAGWRPFTGWICASALAYHFIIEPIIIFALATQNIQLTLPTFDMGSLLTVLMGMLGLGGLRTYEKTKGITK